MAKKILIVDDEEDPRTYLETLFQENGYETATANDGDVAFEKAKEYKPDLITLDIIMLSYTKNGARLQSHGLSLCSFLRIVLT